MLAPIIVGGNPGYGDITPDGAYLYLTDLDADVIHKVNLTTGTDIDLPYTPTDFDETSAWDLKIISGKCSDYQCSQQSAGWGIWKAANQVITLDLTNDTFSTTAPSGLRLILNTDSPLFRSADYSTLLVGNLDSYDDAPFIYDTAAQFDNVGNPGDAYLGAVSPDGSLIALAAQRQYAVCL